MSFSKNRLMQTPLKKVFGVHEKRDSALHFILNINFKLTFRGAMYIIITNIQLITYNYIIISS